MQNAFYDIKTSDTDSVAATSQVFERKAGHTHADIDSSPRITQQKKRQHDIFGPAMQQKSEKEDKTVNQPGSSISPNLTGLPNEVKTNMEAGFNTDFSHIRIHTNSQNALKVNATAYTQGHDIYFAPSQFNPGTNQGRQTIGHELAHVIQQQEGRVQPTGRIANMPVNDSPTLEREADIMGVKVSGITREKTTQRKSKKKITSSPVTQRQIIQSSSNASVLQMKTVTDGTMAVDAGYVQGASTRSTTAITKKTAGGYKVYAQQKTTGMEDRIGEYDNLETGQLRGIALHAETLALEDDSDFTRIAASQDICRRCQAILEERGKEAVNPGTQYTDLWQAPGEDNIDGTRAYPAGAQLGGGQGDHGTRWTRQDGEYTLHKNGKWQEIHPPPW